MKVKYVKIYLSFKLKENSLILFMTSPSQRRENMFVLLFYFIAKKTKVLIKQYSPYF